jgi:hypothetical protein
LVGGKFKKSFAEIVKSSPIPSKIIPQQKKYVFVRLTYPMNYFGSFFTKPPMRKFNGSSINPVPKLVQHVLRW